MRLVTSLADNDYAERSLHPSLEIRWWPLSNEETAHAATLHKFRNEQMTPRGLRLSFCRGRKGLHR
jgi:hypothetical protein